MLTSSGSQQTMVPIVSWPRGKPIIFSKIGQERGRERAWDFSVLSHVHLRKGPSATQSRFSFLSSSSSTLGRARAIVISLGSLDGLAGGWTGERKEIRNLEQFSRRSGIKRAVYDDGAASALPLPLPITAQHPSSLSPCVSLYG